MITASCQERDCDNVQSAICLHCQHYLCVTHIVDHGKLLLKEGDQLCEQINELAEQLNVYFEQVHLARDEATEKLNIWRQNQIDKVEQKYAEKIQVIQFSKDYLTDLENQLTKRLTDEAIQPLEYMQTRQNASSEYLKTIRQAITNIARESVQLDLCLKDPSSQASSPSVINTTTTNSNYSSPSLSSPEQDASIETQSFVNASINSSDHPLLTNTQSPFKQTSSITVNPALTNQATTIAVQTNISSSSTSTIPKPAPTASASTTSKPTASASVTASVNSKTTIKRPPTAPCRSLTQLFQDVSGYSNHQIESFIVSNLNQIVHVNNVMVLFLSLLEASYSPKLPTIINHNVLSYHIKNVKKYLKGSEHQLTIIAASQVFLTFYQYDDRKSSEIMSSLLQLFLRYQCITKEIVLDWYKNGARYGYAGFAKAKLYAKPFIDQLNTKI